jgi:hypothetical protein
MLKKLTLGAALVAAAAFLTPASAAPPVTQTGVAAEGAADGLVQQVHWRHRHWRHRHHHWGYYPYYYPRYNYGGYYPDYWWYRHRHHRHWQRHHHHRW